MLRMCVEADMYVIFFFSFLEDFNKKKPNVRIVGTTEISVLSSKLTNDLQLIRNITFPASVHNGFVSYYLF